MAGRDTHRRHCRTQRDDLKRTAYPLSLPAGIAALRIRNLHRKQAISLDTLSQLRAGKLAGTRRLNLSCGLTRIPEDIFALADTLEVLDLSGNALSDLPDDLARLHKLRVVFLSNNQFEHVPEVLGQCAALSMVGFKANRIRHVSGAALPPALRWLILTDNQIRELPPELGSRPLLQKLMLAGNQLQSLPPEMAALERLELLRIAANRFSRLPDWLFALPRLSWLAYAGNPCCTMDDAAVLAQARVGHVDWQDLAIQAKLGEGASGVIYRAVHVDQATDRQAIAVKVFKGAVTSDGSPENEMAACIAAGQHANLIPIQAKVSAHPEGTPGLVMSLIAPSFRDLAGPPSLESCTRDVYANDTRFSQTAMLELARGIASAVGHLHERGIMHGDLYGHNILRDDEGRSLLGDFGAASFYSLQDTKRAEALQRLEVRAFGCLLEELIDRCDMACDATGEALGNLKERCLQGDVAARPLFAEIEKILRDLEVTTQAPAS